MMELEVTSLSNGAASKLAKATIEVDRHTAPLLLELLNKSVIGGSQAHLLADLYFKVKAAAEAVSDDEA